MDIIEWKDSRYSDNGSTLITAGQLRNYSVIFTEKYETKD